MDWTRKVNPVIMIFILRTPISLLLFNQTSLLYRRQLVTPLVIQHQAQNRLRD